MGNPGFHRQDEEPKTMKAAVHCGPRDIRIEDVPEPELTSDGIIVKVRNCGICGSDLHPYKEPPGRVIPGHEIAGDVVAVGKNVTAFKEGDRVTGIPIRPCGLCVWCQQGKGHLCSYQQWSGIPELSGAMAEYALIPNVQVGNFVTAVRLPDTMSYDEGATVEPLSIAQFSLAQANIQPDDTVVIIGAGMIGLCVLEVLRARGVKKILVSGRRSSRLQLARDGGASVVVDAARDSILPAVQKFTQGAGADVVVECAGVQATYDEAIMVARRFGQILMVGMFEQPVTWSPNFAAYKNIRLIGCLGEDFPGAVELLSSGRATTSQFITHHFALDDVKEAFETQLTADDAVKVMVNIA